MKPFGVPPVAARNARTSVRREKPSASAYALTLWFTAKPFSTASRKSVNVEAEVSESRRWSGSGSSRVPTGSGCCRRP